MEETYDRRSFERSLNETGTVVEHGGASHELSIQSTQSFYKERSGESNRAWKLQVARGDNATTVLNAVKQSRHDRPYAIGEDWVSKNPGSEGDFWTKESNWEGYLRGISCPSLSEVQSIPVTKADNRAKSEFIAAVRRKQTTFQGGVWAAELAKSVALITNPFSRLRRGMRDYVNFIGSRRFRRGLLNRSHRDRTTISLREVKDIIADTYLEWSLGWKPILFDIGDGIELLSQRLKDGPDFEMCKGVGFDDGYLDGGYRYTGSSTPHFKVEFNRHYDVMVKYYGNVEVGSYGLSNTRRVGFDLHSVPLIGWEIMPYSFVIDYFANIQQIVSAASIAQSGLRWTSRTIRVSITSSTGMWEPVVSAETSHQVPTLAYAARGSSQASTATVHRSPYSGSLVPSLEFSAPVKYGQLFNLAALFSRSREVEGVLREMLRFAS